MLTLGGVSPPAIVVRDLRKIYGATAAVDGLNLEVPRGSFFGFLGPNGAGKSTTIRMLTGLIPPNSGEIELLGMPMPAQEIEIKRRIGLVPDESLLFDRLTGAEFLEFVGRMYGLDRGPWRAGAPANCWTCSNSTNDRKLIGEYSKGMRKRVAMAAALIHHPDLFLMDEPFEGVDAVGARLMKDILLDQVRRGATIFLTSHVLEVVERLCDRVAIIHDGRIVTDGAMEETAQAAKRWKTSSCAWWGRGAHSKGWTGCDPRDSARAIAEHAVGPRRRTRRHPVRLLRHHVVRLVVLRGGLDLRGDGAREGPRSWS